VLSHMTDDDNDDDVTQDGTTALHWAAKTTLLRCVNRLLELGAEVNAADKVHFSCILH